MAKKSAKRKARGKALKAVAARESGRAPVSLAETPWDHGATGKANRIGLVVEERGEKDAKTGKTINPNGVTGARRVDLLEFWHKRGSISTEGYNAAEMLRNAFEATQRGKPALPDNDRVQSSPKPDHAVDIQIDRISRFEGLMRHVRITDRAIVTACVLDGQHPGRIVGPLRVREGFAILRQALDNFAASLGQKRKTA